ELLREVGIFDTLGHQTYTNAEQLTRFVLEISDITPIGFDSDRHDPAPIYIVRQQSQIDSDIRILSRVKKARLPFRSFDPQEYGRMSPQDAIENVASSHGVIASLESHQRATCQITNTRAAFVAGLATG